MNMMISYQELVRTFLNGSGEFLTDSGKELIDELISELVEFVKKQKVEAPKTEGHEMGGSDGTDSDTNS